MKEDLRVKRTYKLLSESLMDLMKEKPFEKISVVDICDRAMIHRATFYTHFTDKYDLLRYILKPLQDPFDKSCVTSNTKEGYKDYYMSVAESITDMVFEKKDVMKAVLKKNQEDSFITQLKSALSENIERKLKKCQENGVEMPVPPNFAAKFYAGACISLIECWLEDPEGVTKEKLLRYLDTLIMTA